MITAIIIIISSSFSLFFSLCHFLSALFVRGGKSGCNHGYELNLMDFWPREKKGKRSSLSCYRFLFSRAWAFGEGKKNDGNQPGIISENIFNDISQLMSSPFFSVLCQSTRWNADCGVKKARPNRCGCGNEMWGERRGSITANYVDCSMPDSIIRGERRREREEREKEKERETTFFQAR